MAGIPKIFQPDPLFPYLFNLQGKQMTHMVLSSAAAHKIQEEERMFCQFGILQIDLKKGEGGGERKMEEEEEKGERRRRIFELENKNPC